MTFEQKTANLGAGALTYLTGGAGRALLFLHGAGGLVKTRPLETLAGAHRLYMPVYPGLDGTDYLDGVESMVGLADLMAEFITSDLGGNCDVIGHSLGGWLALWLAARHPGLVDLLVLECPAGFRPGGTGGHSADPEELQRQLFAHPEKMPAMDRSPEEARDNREKIAHYHRGVPLDEDLVAELDAIKNLTLLLHGTLETLIPIETCRILKQGLERCSLVYVHDAAHYIEVDQPERFSAIVGDFLARGEAFIVNQESANETGAGVG